MNRRARWLRAGLGLPAGTQVVLGFWMLLRDRGALNLSLAVVLCAAVSSMERRLVFTAPAAYLAASVPHPGFHAWHSEPLSGAGGAGPLTLLGLGVLLPTALMRPAAVERAFTHRTDQPPHLSGGANSSS